MKPYQVLLFILSALLILLMLAFIFPGDGVKISNGFGLKFASAQDFISKDSTGYSEISEILNKAKTENIESILSMDIDIPDSDYIELSDTISDFSDSLQLKYNLQYLGDSPSVLFPFFEKLHSLKDQKKLVRILHYGDSQIEADRMSSFIRYHFQSVFGGSGCGTVPAVPLYNGHLGIKQDYSSNWKRYTGYSNSGNLNRNLHYGALMSFIRQDSLSVKNKAWLNFKPSPIGYSSSRKYSDISLYIEGEHKTSKIEVFQKEELVDSLILKPSKGLRKLSWHFNNTPDDLKFIFSGGGYTNIYGISFDNSWGVALDNIPLRGSSGLVFSNADTTFLLQMYKMMDVGLIILQFGGNVVPYLQDNFIAYENYFKRELKVIKRMLPGVPVIVIGPSDMSIKDKDRFTTYPNLEGVRDALRNATYESGFVFWDMYEAMGGKNSMPVWVSSNPPLAVSDYVHFNARGARIIAEMFSNSLLKEYKKWDSKFNEK